MPAVGLEPISKSDIFGIYSDILRFCSDIFRFSYTFIFLCSPLERIHHATRNATRKFLQDILVFWYQINKIFVSPNSVPNHPKIIPTQKVYIIIFESWILGHFGHFRTFLETFRTFSEKSVIKSHFYVIKVLYFVRLWPCCVFAAKHATITQLIRNSDTLTSYKQVK